MITIEDFKKLDIRIGKVISAEKITEKLIKRRARTLIALAVSEWHRNVFLLEKIKNQKV